MMADFLNTIMTALAPKTETTSTAKSKQNSKDVTSAYEAEAQELIKTGDTNGSNLLSLAEIMALSPLKSKTNKRKVAETLFFGKESGGLGLREVAQLLAPADINRDGKLSPEEKKNVFTKMLRDLDQGKSVEETYANQLARELKAGVRFSDAKLEKAEKLFAKYDIRYTPKTDEVTSNEDDTSAEKTGWEAMLPKFLPLLTDLFKQPKNSDTSNPASPTVSADTSKALDPSTSQATLNLAKQAASLGVPSLGTTSPLGGTPLLSAALPTPTLPATLPALNPLMTAGTNTALPMLQNPTFPTTTPVLMPSAAATLPTAPASGAWNPAINTTPNTAWNVGATPFSFTPSAGLPAGTSWGTPPTVMPTPTPLLTPAPVMLASTANPQYNGGW
jgi:hypothetical protein